MLPDRIMAVCGSLRSWKRVPGYTRTGRELRHHGMLHQNTGPWQCQRAWGFLSLDGEHQINTPWRISSRTNPLHVFRCHVSIVTWIHHVP